MKKLCIAIDGPAGAGKSTIAKLVADYLHYNYLDTGAMYRAVCWLALESGVCFDDEIQLNKLLSGMDLQLIYKSGATTVIVDGIDITDAIRTQEISNAVSIVAKSASVRTALVHKQRQLSAGKGIVMDGRDIGTVVLPDAELKIFLTASADERARRRFNELKERGTQVDYAALKKEIEDRDYADSHREIAPLKQADDAILMDTTSMNIEQVRDKICALSEGIC